MAQVPSVCDFGWKAPGFSLPATDGKTYDLSDVSGPNGTLVMFICNHCPYVLSVLDRIIRDAHDLQAMGVGVAAISANDVVAYPQDSFENMGKMPGHVSKKVAPGQFTGNRRRRICCLGHVPGFPN